MPRFAKIAKMLPRWTLADGIAGNQPVLGWKRLAKIFWIKTFLGLPINIYYSLRGRAKKRRDRYWNGFYRKFFDKVSLAGKPLKRPQIAGESAKIAKIGGPCQGKK